MKLSERVIIVLMGKLVSGALLFATGILLARMLTRINFGTYQQAMLIATYVAPFALFGIDQTVTFFIPRLQESRQIKTFIYQTTMILFVIGFGVSIALFMCSGLISRVFHNDHLTPALRIFALYPIFSFPFSIVSLVLYSLDKQKISALLEILSSCVQFVVVAILVWLELDVRWVLLALVILTFVKMLVSVAIYRWCLENRSTWKPDRELLGDQLRFATPLGISKILPVITVNLDKLVISGFYTVKDFAIYSVGAIELPFVSLITYSMGNVISPQLSRLFYEGKKAELIQIWHRMIHKTSMCLYPIFIFFMINAGDFITSLYSDKYKGSVAIFQVYLFLLLVRVSDNAAVVRACNAPSIMLKASIVVFAVNFSLTFVLMKTIGFLGPAVATVIAIYVNFAYIMNQLRRILGLSYGRILPWRYMGKVLMVSMACGLIVIPLNSLVTIGVYSLVLKGLVFAVAYIVLTTRLGILEESDWVLIRKYTGAGVRFIRKSPRTNRAARGTP